MATAKTCDAAIVGAGPYGLAVAAHLRRAGVDTHVFGDTMRFWRQNMPEGMLLRSGWDASHIADPSGELTLDAYQADRGQAIPIPIPLADFVSYGEWYQQRAVPEVDGRSVEVIERADHGFRLELDDGDQLRADRIVMATGLVRFPRRPSMFSGMGDSLVSHSSDHADLRRFAGTRVLVVGGGQSALESAALLYEGGADVEVVIRASQVHWLAKSRVAAGRGPVQRILYPKSEVGPPGLNWIIALPDLLRALPQSVQLRAAQSIPPAGADWLRFRLRRVPLATNLSIVSAAPVGQGLLVRLDDGTERHVDHIMLATGYRIETAGYALLAPALRQSLRTIRGCPALGSGLESSIPGLHFVGAAAMESFGPLMRFVAGTGYTGRAVTRGVRAAGSTRRSASLRRRFFGAQPHMSAERP